MTVECAFGRLKGRWRFMLKRYDGHIDSIPRRVKASCILHNIIMCEVHGGYFDEQWLNEVYLQDRQPARAQFAEVHDIDDRTIRQALCHWVNANRT